MEIDLAEQPASEIKIAAPIPLNSPIDRARDSLRIRNWKAEIAAPNSIEFSNGSRAIVCESEIGNMEIAAPNSIEFCNGSSAIVCESEIRNWKSPRYIQLNSPRELAVDPAPPPEFYTEIGGCSGPPSIKVVWYLQLALTVINALGGWSVSALVGQNLNAPFNWA